MLKFGETMTEGTISRWLKREGDLIKEGELLYEIETDKANLEVEAKTSGILAKILVTEGKTVPIGETIALITGEEENPKDLRSIETQSAKVRSEDEPAQKTVSTPKVTIQQDSKIPLAGGKVRATPAAKRLARKAGIDLSTVESEYHDGVIVEETVLALLQNQAKVSPTAQKMIAEYGRKPKDLKAFGTGGESNRQDGEDFLWRRENNTEPAVEKVMALEGIRKVIAERMMKSVREAPQVTLTTRVDMKEAITLRKRLLALVEEHITYTDILLLVIARTLKRFPRINAYFENQTIIHKGHVNLGLAVDTSRGLVVPVIKNADLLGIKEIVDQRINLVKKAREGRLTSDEMQGGTFTVSNLGNLDVEVFTPILNPPEIAILGVGKIVEEPVVVEGQITIKPIVWLSLTFDHRAIDGAPAAKFLQEIKKVLEEPWRLLL